MSERKDTQMERSMPDEVSLKSLIVTFKGFVAYLFSKWLIVMICVLVGAILGMAYSAFKRTTYTANVSFILEEQTGGGGSLGAAAGLAAQFGINLGGMAAGSGGFFQGDNIIEFLKSRAMINKTLLTEVEIGGQRDLLVNRYITYNKFRNHWAKNEPLENLQFKDTIGIFLQDSLMSNFHKSILNNNLEIGKLDRKLNILSINMKTPDEEFSKAFVETLIENASQFYIQIRTKKSQENLAVLTHQVDSVRKELNAAIGGVAAATDANPNPNRAFQSLRVGSQLRTVDVQANTEILKELVTNQELAKITLLNERPVIQILDKPILPLENDKLSKTKGLIIGAFLGGFLSCLLLSTRRIYRQIMEDDESQ